MRNYDYTTSSYKYTHIRNPFIRVVQHIMALGIFARDDSVNVPRLSEMYFLSCMLEGERLNPGPFLARQFTVPPLVQRVGKSLGESFHQLQDF